MIRKFEYGILCLRSNDKFITNLYSQVKSTNCFYHMVCLSSNQVYSIGNPLLAPRALADWSYNE